MSSFVFKHMWEFFWMTRTDFMLYTEFGCKYLQYSINLETQKTEKKLKLKDSVYLFGYVGWGREKVCPL